LSKTPYDMLLRRDI